MKRWTKAEKEWLGHKRKMAVNKDKISLAPTPWNNGEHDDQERRKSVDVSTSEPQCKTTRRGRRV